MSKNILNLKSFLRSGQGATDITPLLLDRKAFSFLIDQMCNLFEGQQFDVVTCIEGRGFILGGAIALKLGCGVVPLRNPSKLKNKVYSSKFIDYSGKEKELQIHKDAITVDQKVLIVDDWLETGSTIKTAIELVEMCGGKVNGVAIFMDDSSVKTKDFLSKYNYKYIEKVETGDSF